MNWMTSGRHRALYSQRGRRRQMHFPSQVQHQRVRTMSPPRNSQPARARDSATPWYIVPVGDEDESQDIRVLELERKGAMTTADVAAEKTEQQQPASDIGTGGGVSPSRKRSGEHQERDGQEGRNESRCIFTPIKKARKYDRLPRRVKPVQAERPPSSIVSGVDMLFFNDGEELQRKNRAQRVNQVSTEPARPEARDRRFSQQNGHQEARQNYQGGDVHSRESDIQDQFDGENTSFDGHHRFPDNTDQSDQRGFQLWRVNSNSCASSSPDSAFARPDSAACRSTKDPIHENFHSTLSSSPFASPLSFRMSRTEVLQSQLSTKIHQAKHDPLETRMRFTPSPHPSPSPSTSTSSQGSIVLGRPPIGWHKKLLLSLQDDTARKPENRFDSHSSCSENLCPSPPAYIADNNPGNVHDSNNPREFPMESSPSSRSSAGSDGDNSIIDAIVPIDAKERIMATATSQHHPEDSRKWLQRQSTTEFRDTNGADTVFSDKSMAFQQSWVMSSRTKTILDAVSSSKSSGQDAIWKHDTKHQEMESVAIYMYTLVQCYKIDESLRFVRSTDFFTKTLVLMLRCLQCREVLFSVAEHTQLVSKATSPPTASALMKQTPCRGEIIFSPKRAN